jgi:quercetin dioxygenase-like cupin family protein
LNHATGEIDTMRPLASRRSGAASLALLLLALAASGGQPTPSGTRRIPQFENDRVRVWKSIIAPHQPLTLHRHDRPRVVVVLSGGTLTIVEDSGTRRTVTWESGRAYWLDPDPPGTAHGDLNEGPSPIEVMVIELTR